MPSTEAAGGSDRLSGEGGARAGVAAEGGGVAKRETACAASRHEGHESGGTSCGFVPLSDHPPELATLDQTKKKVECPFLRA